MKLVTYNMRFGLGLDQQIDLGRIAGAVQDADIIALQEVERFWKRSSMVDQPEILASHMQKFGTDKLTKNVCAKWEIDTPMDQ